MWPERLLHVSQTIREIADDEVRGELFRLAQMRTPRTYSELSLYDSQFIGVIRSLMKSAVDQIRVAENLATPLDTEVRDAIKRTIMDLRTLLSRFGPSGSDDFSSAQGDLMNANEIFNALPVFDFGNVEGLRPELRLLKTVHGGRGDEHCLCKKAGG